MFVPGSCTVPSVMRKFEIRHRKYLWSPHIDQRHPRRTVAERQAFLEADARVEEAQPDQVKCRGCQNWVRLSTKRQYELQRWYRHQDYCKATTYVPLVKPVHLN